MLTQLYYFALLYGYKVSLNSFTLAVTHQTKILYVLNRILSLAIIIVIIIIIMIITVLVNNCEVVNNNDSR